MPIGADVNYGALTRDLLGYLKTLDGFAAQFKSRVKHVRRQPDGRWDVTVEDMASGARRTVRAKFVFLGAGGGALPLLQDSGIPEAKGYAGFPVSGIWLRCDKPEDHGSVTMLRSTARPRSAPRPCQCRIWTPGSSTESDPCCSVPMPDSRPSS